MVLVLLLVLMAPAPAFAQTATSTATPTDSGPDYEGCHYGPRAPGQPAQLTPLESPYLVVETRDLYQPNETYSYDVYRVEVSPEGTTRQYRVTDSASVSSSNTSILTVNEAEHTISSVNDENVSTWVRLDASTADYEGCANVMVARPTVANLEITPGIWRFVAVLGDPTMFALLIAVFLAVAAARFTSSFGGLAIGQITLVVGWLGGWVEWEMAVASLFVALFIGLNVAANVDYQSGRLRT